MDPDAVAKAFVEHYYTTFDANRAGLGNLYQEASMLSFEGEKIQGSQSIVVKLTSLPFQQCKHNIATVDCQPSGPAGGMLVFVSGTLQLAGEQHALKFSQCLKRCVPHLCLRLRRVSQHASLHLRLRRVPQCASLHLRLRRAPQTPVDESYLNMKKRTLTGCFNNALGLLIKKELPSSDEATL